MVGYEVNKNVIDIKVSDAVLSLRSAFGKVESIAKYLSNNPVVNNVDPLVTQFGYSNDEAYLVRVTFETLESLRTANVSTFETARKLTGLE